MDKDTKIIKNFFNKQAKQYGNSVNSLAWQSEYTQQARFWVFTEIAPLDGMRILDVGCGKADFYEYLLKEGLNITYYGVDCALDLVKLAKASFPGVNIFYRDFLHDAHYPEVDYVFASGVANLLMPNNLNYMESMIRKMFSLARKGVGVNMLSNKSSHTEKDGGMFFYYPDQLLKFALTITPDVVLRHDYLTNDFTLYLYKER